MAPHFHSQIMDRLIVHLHVHVRVHVCLVRQSNVAVLSVLSYILKPCSHWTFFG